MLLRQVANDRDIEINTAIGSGIAGGADDHRHADAAGANQHHLEIVRLPGEWAGRGVGPERHRPDIVAAGIRGDVIRSRLHAEPVTLGLDGGEAQMPIGRNDRHRLHRFGFHAGD